MAPKGLNCCAPNEGILNRMVETLTALERPRMGHIASQRDSPLMIILLMLWQTGIPVAKLLIPDFALVRHSLKDTPPGIRKLTCQFLLASYVLFHHPDIDLVACLWKRDVMEKSPILWMANVNTIMQIQPSAIHIKLKVNLVDRMMRLHTKEKSLLAGVGNTLWRRNRSVSLLQSLRRQAESAPWNVGRQ